MTDRADGNDAAVFSEMLQGGLGLALELMPLGVTITDLERRILYTNPAEASMHGYSVDELLGRPSRIFAPPGYARRLPQQELGRAAAWQREAINVRRDGSTFPVRLQSRVVRSEDQPVVIVTTCQDISDHVRSIKALRASEQRYRSFVERAAHGIYQATPTGRFLDVNPALVRMLGYRSSREVLGLDIARDVFVDPMQRQHLLQQVRDGRHRTGIEVQWKQRDGSMINVRLSGTAVYDAQGDFEYVEMFAEDVTERQSLRAQLRQVQKMELLGEWTGGIAHDFNNILTVILTNAEIAQSALQPGQRELRDELDVLRSAAVRGTALVRKLMGFAKRENVRLESIDLQRTISDLLETVRRLLPETIDVELRHTGRLPRVRTDPGVVEQVLLNLATNARDAMDRGGRLVIQTSVRTVKREDLAGGEWGAPGSYVCVAVRDNGVGMDAKTREQVFEPFFTTKGSGAGTGLGMAMVYRLMEQHRGFVDIESAPGEGTVVTVYFPVADRLDAATETPEASPAPRGGSETLLVVEDEESIRRATKRLLERYGYTVLLAADGIEALEVIEQRPREVDLVITDFVMPRMTGPQLYDAVRRRNLPTPFIMVSGYSEDADETRHASRPDVPFMRKPWAPAGLLDRVREVLDTARR